MPLLRQTIATHSVSSWFHPNGSSASSPATQMSNHGVSVIRVLSVSRYVTWMPIGLTTTRSAGMTGMKTNCIVAVHCSRDTSRSCRVPDEDEVGDRSVRLGGIGLNPKDDILDPEFFGGDPGGQHGDFLVAGGEGRVGQIDGEKTEAARPVLLGRRPAPAEMVMEKAVEEILGGGVAGIGLGLDRLIGQGFGPADFIPPERRSAGAARPKRDERRRW